MKNAAVQGASPSYFKMGVTNIAEGRYFTDEENALHSNVVVIGNDVANTLFPFSNALDQNVSINGRLYRVVGVLAERDIFLIGAEDPNNENKAVYMPYLTLRKLYPDVDDNFVMAQAHAGKMEAAVEEIRELLRRRRKVAYGAPDNFGVSTSDQILTQFGAITGGIFALMVAISSVGLLIGGIGVMNIMLVSVTERTREIGVRKAIGARRRDIVAQFLIEAGTLDRPRRHTRNCCRQRSRAADSNADADVHSAVGADCWVCCFRWTGCGVWLWPAWKAARLESDRGAEVRISLTTDYTDPNQISYLCNLWLGF